MSKFKAELWVTCLAVLTASTGTALAQSSDDPYAVPPDQEPAQAQPEQAPAPPPPMAEPYGYEESETRGMYGGLKRVGFSLTLGGGVVDFTDSTMRNTTNVGGSWAVRAAFGTRSPLGFEASYIGSAQSIDALGLDRDAVLVGNGLQGALRLNAVTGTMASPYLFAGLGWTRYSLTRTDRNLSAIADDDDVLEIPVGLGIEGSYRGFGWGLRGEFRFATNEDLVPEINAGRVTDDFASMHRWGVSAMIGYSY